jgi:GntR family transcriptional regulator
MDMHSALVISQTDGRPMYLQIMEQIKQLVGVGEWQPGQEIPSIRQLAVALKVSVITVKRAYLELEREGVIVTQQGKGSSVAARPELKSQLWEAELEQHLAEILRLGALLGQGPDELATRLRQAAATFNKERS